MTGPKSEMGTTVTQTPKQTASERAGMGRGRRPGAFLAVLVLCVLVVSGCSSAPPYQGMSAEQIFQVGQQAMEEEEWDDAIQAFERLISGQPGFARLAEVRFALGEAHFEKGQYLMAASEWELFMTRYPSNGRVPEASLGICRSFAALSPHPRRDQTYTERARDACRQTRNEFQGMNVADEAEEIRAGMVEKLARKVYLTGQDYQRWGAHDSAIIYFQDVVDFYPETSWAPEGLLGMYRSYREIGWEEEAEAARRRLLSNYPDSQAAVELRAEDGEAPRAGQGQVGESSPDGL